MKNTILFILIVLVIACKPQTSTEQVDQVPDNPELILLKENDQNDRKTPNIDWSIVSERDRLRQERIYQLLDSNMVKTALDYSNAAMIFQHGHDTIASTMAVKMMRKAIELDSSINKWLLAAAIDRDLMRQGEPQIYGTQFTRKGADEPWVRYEIDSSIVTDEERKEYGVETLAEQRTKVEMMNKIKITALYSSGISIDEILQICKSEESKNYDLSETTLNRFGYQLMKQENNEDALKIFQFNTERYPESFNTHDSYGECLISLGKTDEGIAAYKKSLELNPANQNAEKILADLKKP